MINPAYHFASERTNRTEKSKQVNNFPVWICYVEIEVWFGFSGYITKLRTRYSVAQKSVHKRQTLALKKSGGGVDIIRKTGNLGRRPACVPETNSQLFAVIID